MTNERLTKHFESIGARIKFRPLLPPRPWNRDKGSPRLRLDISRDRKGEYFDFALADNAPGFELLQARSEEHHLLLLTTDGRRYLCGHDERHWFIAGIGGRVSTVRDARRSLMPPRVRDMVRSLPPGEIDNRKNPVFVRQGEWFFVPTRRHVTESRILRDEPLQRRPGSKPHICKELVREGGKLVYIVHGKAYSAADYERTRREVHSFPRAARTMIRNPRVFVRGTVRHPDHSTITLRDWHQVFLNGEYNASETVAFLD